MQWGTRLGKKASMLLAVAGLLCVGLPIGFSQTPNTPPAVEWQIGYGHPGPYDDTNVGASSNLIQTIDGGYVFMDLGWSYQFTFMPSTIFKVDSSGNLQWTKTIDFLEARTIVQTNDEGYEISGYWSTYGTTYENTPTLIKTDPEGEVQWVANYSSVPDLGIASTGIGTSDDGVVFWNDGDITKTDPSNSTQWVKHLTYTGADGTAPLELTSVIETSDGALAAIGVGYSLFDNPRTGRVYLVKTEAFLPVPSPNQLPTPIPTAEPASTALFIALIILVAVGTIALIVVILTVLLVYYRRSSRKS